MAAPDYYQILGISNTATEKEIKSAYKKLAKQYHPDVNPSSDSQEKFKEISKAYQVLSDADKKSAYDRLGHSAYEQARQSGYTNQSTNANYEDIFGGFRDPMDIFSEFFGQSGFGRRQTQRSNRGEDLELTVKISFLEAVKGAEKQIQYSAYSTCKTCKGSGSKDNQSPTKCTQCDGNGQVYQHQSILGAQFTQVVPCPTCNGTGKIIKDPCFTCRGTGREKESQKPTLRIPAGVDNGTQVIYRGKGNAGPNNGPAGDLYVAYKVTPDKTFHRQGNDLHLNVATSIPTAVLGGSETIPTLDGNIELKIPSGTQPNQEFRLSGKGVPRVNTNQIGDLIVHIQIEIPKKLDTKQKALFQQLKDADQKPNNFLDNLFA